MTKQELERCINEYGRDIYSFCKQLACNQQEADDLYQDTFLMAVQLSEKMDYANNPKSYLLSIALRIWRNRKRKYAWRKRIAEMQSIVDERDLEADISTEKSMEMSPEGRILTKEKEEAVREAVNRLPRRLKITVLLFYMEELSTAQIAAVLGIPAGTVMSRLHQARKRLQKELEDVYEAGI